MAINWFPGHMKKAREEIQKKLKQVDLCCEILDARALSASHNAQLDSILSKKPRIQIANKKDLAEESVTQAWLAKASGQGRRALALNSKLERPGKKLYLLAQELLAEKEDFRKDKGIINPEIRMLVYGIPNVGKSSFINALAEKKKAKTGDRPGITKDQAWIKTDSPLLLLDTPGLLPTKLSEEEGMKLALTGAIPRELFSPEELAFFFLKLLIKKEDQRIYDRYPLEKTQDPLQLFQAIGAYTGALLKGGEIDAQRTGQRILDDLRRGKLGRISLDEKG